MYTMLCSLSLHEVVLPIVDDCGDLTIHKRHRACLLQNGGSYRHITRYDSSTAKTKRLQTIHFCQAIHVFHRQSTIFADGL